jgi:hypothetical protein
MHSDFLRSMKNGARLSDVEGILLAAKDAGQPLEPLVNARGMWGNTPLILVACQNRLAQVSLILLRAGADVNHKNDRSASALLYACMEGLEDVVNSMLALGANVDISAVLVYSPASDSMQTLCPLMAAVRNGHVGVCEALLQSGVYSCMYISGEIVCSLVLQACLVLRAPKTNYPRPPTTSTSSTTSTISFPEGRSVMPPWLPRDILLLDIIGYKRHLATSQLLPSPMRSCGNHG